MESSGGHGFEHNLHGLVTELVRMLSLVKHGASLAQRALIGRDASAAEECARNEEQVDALMEDLERQVITIIARHQPTAKDLRFLGAVSRRPADVERAGDDAQRGARGGWQRSAR